MQRITPTLEDSMIILRWALAVIAVFVGFAILTQTFANKAATDRNHQTGIQNNTYLRTIACVLSVPLADRTNDYISNCYLKAEIENNTKVDHFGNK